MTKKMLRVYTTLDGIELKLNPVSSITRALAEAQVEKEFRARGEPVDVPTYEVETLGGEGDPETFPLTEDTLEDLESPVKTRENRAKWARYMDALLRLEREKDDRVLAVTLGMGVDCEVPDDGWEQPFTEWMGLTIPEQPMDRKVFYLNHVALRTDMDRQLLMTQLNLVTAGTEVTPEQVELFRGKFSNITDRLLKDAVAQFGERAGTLASQLGIPSNDDDEGMEDTPVTVEGTESGG